MMPIHKSMATATNNQMITASDSFAVNPANTHANLLAIAASYYYCTTGTEACQ